MGCCSGSRRGCGISRLRLPEKAMKYFTPNELRCHHCDESRLHPGFGEALDTLREAFGEPMAVTSACRCLEHNTDIKGHELSLHIADKPAHADKGQQGALAIDIATPDGAYRGRLFSAAWRLGWSIGWNAKKGFLHLDRRSVIGLSQTTFDY